MGTDIALVLSSAQPTTISKNMAIDHLKAEPTNDNKIFFDTNLYLPDAQQKTLSIDVEPIFLLYINQMPTELTGHFMAEEFSKKYIKSKPKIQGRSLPAGQRQRILMALTLNRRRVTILPDEAISHLESASELQKMTNILPLPEPYFFINNRPDTAVVANHIVELKPP